LALCFSPRKISGFIDAEGCFHAAYQVGQYVVKDNAIQKLFNVSEVYHWAKE
jgi:hypothetical protein